MLFGDGGTEGAVVLFDGGVVSSVRAVVSFARAVAYKAVRDGVVADDG